jgi:hypothetical protein
MACALGVAAVALAAGAGYGADDKLPTIKEIMTKGHKGTDAYMAKIKADAKAGKWDEAKEYAQTLATFGAAMPKLKPSKGSAESWKALSEKYAASTKATLKAVESKDAAAVNKALGGINCMECHKAHRGK